MKYTDTGRKDAKCIILSTRLTLSLQKSLISLAVQLRDDFPVQHCYVGLNTNYYAKL